MSIPIMTSKLMTTLRTNYAPDAFRLLNGVFCIYKPAGIKLSRVREMVVGNLVRDLNLMEPRPARDLVKIIPDPADSNELIVTTVPDLADNPQVVGPRYQAEDFRIRFVDGMHKQACGVCVLGIGNGCRLTDAIYQARHVKVYELAAQFGSATDDFTNLGRVVEKTTYRHITDSKLDRVLGAIMSSHVKASFDYAGVNIQSQEAYELATRGLIRPMDRSSTLIYGMKCTKFAPPYFNIEVQCINENFSYLAKLVHEIGLELKSSAMTLQARRTRLGHFHLEHALLRKHWNVQDIVQNIYSVLPLVKNDKNVKSADRAQRTLKVNHTSDAATS
ncbi:PREDICTED: probable tRNA pseudouridine synthase 2 [Priapulus caudatus]|uniref:Probable tRNA pseudouridine synthase 2 n=1 Tax=Priapulus caudatus TaxID=37621 RepID=A0ABM1DU62_PRICU|nr:PREDICTED: probable tRNA pseudouridine synthase 2 [Priapulus caudatus]